MRRFWQFLYRAVSLFTLGLLDRTSFPYGYQYQRYFCLNRAIGAVKRKGVANLERNGNKRVATLDAQKFASENYSWHRKQLVNRLLVRVLGIIITLGSSFPSLHLSNARLSSLFSGYLNSCLSREGLKKPLGLEDPLFFNTKRLVIQPPFLIPYNLTNRHLISPHNITA